MNSVNLGLWQFKPHEPTSTTCGLQLSHVSFLFCQPRYYCQLQGRAVDFLLSFLSKRSGHGYLRPSLFALSRVSANIAKLSFSLIIFWLIYFNYFLRKYFSHHKDTVVEICLLVHFHKDNQKVHRNLSIASYENKTAGLFNNIICTVHATSILRMQISLKLVLR